jgi:flagellar biosynthesis protein FlhG
MPREDGIDQAMGLRNKMTNNPVKSWEIPTQEWIKTPHAEQAIRVIAISSGKGGVGKSSVVVNLALALDRLGKRVLIMDADLGLANIDILLGLAPKYNISHVLDGSKRLEDVLVQGPGMVRVMPASSGVQELTKLTDDQKLLFLEMLDGLETEIDILLIDTGAGISDTVVYFNLAAQEKIVLVTPEPTSLTDAYALIKVLYTRHEERHFKILTNVVKDEAAGKAIFAKISKVADHFLDGLSLDYLGAVPYDPCMPKAVMQQKPLLELFPQAPAAKAFVGLANKLQKTPPPHLNHGNIQFFWKRLLHV